jgi:hypothetical protein
VKIFLTSIIYALTCFGLQRPSEGHLYRRVEVIGGWRKQHNEELHNLYSSPNIIRMTKSRRMRWQGM